MIHRSFLFVPADRPERFNKALGAGADVVILDLEDAVTPERKDSARGIVSEFIGHHAACWVRMNGIESSWFEGDLLMLRGISPAGVMIPKAEAPEVFNAVSSTLGRSLPLVALIESAMGLARCRELARLAGVDRLAFGSVDFALDLGIKEQDDELLFARSELVLASRLAGRPAPIDGVTLALDSDQVLAKDVERARRLGFGGKLCIHPKQIAATNAGFQPDASEIEWARRVVSAADANPSGALRLDGRLVDRPVVEQARRLLSGIGMPASAD